jgi:hypothetical protein
VAFDETRREALKRWYAREEVLAPIRAWLEKERWLELEEYVRQGALFPIAFREGLPEWLGDEDGKPLFGAADLNPATNRDGWAEAVDIGWSVLEERLGIRRDDVIGRIEKIQDDDWQRFLASVEERKRRRAADGKEDEPTA